MSQPEIVTQSGLSPYKVLILGLLVVYVILGGADG